MELTVENTAVVLDSTADFPQGPERFGNWRIVPLYVRFGDISYQDYVDLGPGQFYALLREATQLPSTSQPTPGDFLACYESLAGYGRVLSLHISAKMSGTAESALAAAEELGDGRVRVVDTESEHYRVARDYMIRLERENLQDEEMRRRLAGAAHLSPDEFLAEFSQLWRHEEALAK